MAYHSSDHDGVTIRPHWGWSGVVTTAAFLLFVTNLDLFLSVRGYLTVNALAVFLGFFGGFLLLLSIAGDRDAVLDRVAAGIVLNRVPLVLFLAWVVMHVVGAGQTVLAGEDVDWVQIFPLFQFGVLVFGVMLAAADRDGSAIRIAGRLAILVLGGSVIVETILPGALGNTTSRSGGVALNANIPGFIIPALLAVSLDYRRLRQGDAVTVLFALVAVTCTLSRMGLGMLAGVVLVYAVFRYRGGHAGSRVRGALLLGVAAVIVAGSLLVLSRYQETRGGEFQARVQSLIEGRSILEDPYRGPLLDHYTGVAREAPWLGHGAGETLMNEVSRAPLGLGPHSMYLRAWIDTGIAGLFFYTAFVVSVVGVGIMRRSLPCTMVGILVAAYGAFSHNVVDNKAVLILVGVALGQSVFRLREP